MAKVRRVKFHFTPGLQIGQYSDDQGAHEWRDVIMMSEVGAAGMCLLRLGTGDCETWFFNNRPSEDRNKGRRLRWKS